MQQQQNANSSKQKHKAEYQQTKTSVRQVEEISGILAPEDNFFNRWHIDL